MMMLFLLACLCLMVFCMYDVYRFFTISMNFRYQKQCYIGCSILVAISMILRFSFHFYQIESDLLSTMILYICSYSFFVYILLFFVYWAYRFYHRYHPNAIGKRWFLITLLMASLITSFSLWNATQIKKKEYVVPIAGLTKDMDLMLVSDLHISTSVKQTQIQKLFTLASQERVEAILIAGDLFDESTTKKDMQYFCDQAKRSRQQIYYALGNHESLSPNKQAYLAMLTKANVKILQDETVLLDHQLLLVGRKDKMEKQRKPLADLVSQNEMVLVMDHRPVYDETKVALQVSGHTHNGQIAINQLFTSIVYPHIYGSYDDPYPMIVTSGYGTWGFPMRLASQNEYVILHIVNTAK